jgi:hypothetical protein
MQKTRIQIYIADSYILFIRKKNTKKIYTNK